MAIRRSARARIVASIALLLAFAAVVSTLALRQVLLARVDDRIEGGLAQEVAELRRLANQTDTDDVQRLFDTFFARDVPDEGEASFAFVGSRPYRSNADLGTSEALLDRVRSLGETLEVTRGDIEGTRYIAVPMTDDGTRRGVFVVTADLAHERAEVSEAVQVSAGIALAMLVLVSGLAFVAVGRVLAPLRALGATARSIGSTDDLTRRIDVRTDDEIGELGHLFNAMLDRLEQAFALQREFVSDAGHELRTPITIIRGHLELLEERDRATLKIVTDELDRMSRFVEDLLTLAKAERPDFLHLDTLDLDLLTDELMVKATKLAPRDWRLEHTGAGLLTADRQRLTQAVMNLAHNAVQHTTESDTIALGSELADGDARIWVADTGPGIAPEDRERIFERHVRSAHKDGAGLGLAIVRTIAQAHHGRIELDSEPGAGARFTIVIPAERA
jgi:signal transduction histidine kinase